MLTICMRPGNELVKDGHATERAAFPFGIIFLEFGVDRFQERSDKGYLEGWAHDVAFVYEVHD